MSKKTAQAAGPADEPSELNEYEQQIQQLTDALQRERADIINVRRQHDEQIANLEKHSVTILDLARLTRLAQSREVASPIASVGEPSPREPASSIRQITVMTPASDQLGNV